MKINKLDLAYMAGIVDGEGSIMITHNHNDAWKLRINVGNTDKRLLEWIQKRFGGSLCEISRPSPDKNYLLWQVSCQKALSVIKKIYPFLILKKEQAEVAVEFRSKIKRYSGGKKLTAEETSRRNQLAEKMRNLNRKGRSLGG